MWWDCTEFQLTMCGSKELEFLLVSVYSTNNVNERVYILACGICHMLIQQH